ncbi:hypothetical protein [Actinomycetospora straminea]|uniref:Uncharacterized protein n=1 Tax=Actinomycetospora straminea TaxID=663607 RepID=A0ABP9DWG8_9PSEU|nr:hypothetical protein [Actinomycetospora straminea]MDD7934200.1 hypothetical protein [Actinomycetospora straminea]
MADDPHPPDTARGRAGRRVLVPRWVTVFVLVVLAIALALLVHTIVGGGSHGPAQHGSAALVHVGTVPTRVAMS